MAVPRTPCRIDDARGSCIPAVSDGWCLRISQCEAGSAAVSAVQGGQCCSVPAMAVPWVPAVMDEWYLCSAGSALNPCSDGREVALYPGSAPCPCSAGWVAALQPCRAGRAPAPLLVLLFLQGWQMHAVPLCLRCAWQAVALHCVAHNAPVFLW